MYSILFLAWFLICFTQELLNKPAWSSDRATNSLLNATLKKDTHDFPVFEIHRTSARSWPSGFVDDYFGQFAFFDSEISRDGAYRCQGDYRAERETGERNWRTVRLRQSFKADRHSLISFRFDRCYRITYGEIQIWASNTVINLETEPFDFKAQTEFPSWFANQINRWDLARFQFGIQPRFQIFHGNQNVICCQKLSIATNEKAGAFNCLDFCCFVWSSSNANNRNCGMFDLFDYGNERRHSYGAASVYNGTKNNRDDEFIHDLPTNGTAKIPTNFTGNCIVESKRGAISYKCSDPME
jgi:hypothetical protein